MVLFGCRRITPPPYQARKTFSEKEIKKAGCEHFAERPFCSPSACAPRWTGAGSLLRVKRRLRACRLAGMRTIPAIVSF